MRRSGMLPVYIGDVGVIYAPQVFKPIPDDEYLDKLTWRELFTVAVECGIKVQDLIGVNKCTDHYGMVYLPGTSIMPQGYNLAEHCSWCKSCFRMFRLAKIYNEHD